MGAHGARRGGRSLAGRGVMTAVAALMLAGGSTGMAFADDRDDYEPDHEEPAPMPMPMEPAYCAQLEMIPGIPAPILEAAGCVPDMVEPAAGTAVLP